jgi:hypothetical protein
MRAASVRLAPAALVLIANYLWSQRNAQFPALAGRRQTLGTVGIYYTLPSKQGFGAVDWR